MFISSYILRIPQNTLLGLRVLVLSIKNKNMQSLPQYMRSRSTSLLSQETHQKMR